MKVPRYNYPQQFGDSAATLLEELGHMMLDGRYVLTEEVRHFERSFAEYLGVGNVRGVNTGTDAILVALIALGIGKGDAVITQANTFNATVNAIRFSGATPVLVDADEKSFLIDESQVAGAITPQTRAIIPVHLYGKPTPMHSLLSLGSRKNVSLVEDAAQAHGARIDGKAIGSIGIAGCFSFHPSKNLAAAGDAGAIATHDNKLTERIERIRNLGERQQNEHLLPGVNSKLDAIQARILSWKLPHLDDWNESRRRVARWYRQGLADLPLAFQTWTEGEEHVFHLFQVRTAQRDALFTYLLKAGIDVVIRYPTPIHLQPAFAEYGWRLGQFPVAEKLANELLCLPIRPDLSESEAQYVVEQVRKFFRA